ARIQRRELDAIIGRQTGEVNIGDAARLEITIQPSGLAVRVVEERAVAIDPGIGSLAEDLVDIRDVQPRDELGAARVLHAMDRPEDLPQAVEVDDLAGRAA